MLTKQEMILDQQKHILHLLKARQQDVSEYQINDDLLPVKDQQGLKNLESQLQESDFRMKLVSRWRLI